MFKNSKLSITPSISKNLASENKINILIKNLYQNINNSQLIIHGCITIFDEIKGFDERSKIKRKEFIQQKLIDVLMLCFMRHIDCQELQLQGFYIIWSLSNDEENQIALINLEIPNFIVEVMDVYKMEEKIQYLGCCVLGNLSENEFIQTKMVEMGFGDLILKAMKFHKRSEEVQAYGCKALLHFSLCKNNKNTLVDLGVIEAIINAMKNHENNLNIQECGCITLKNLGDDNIRCIKLLKAGASDVVVNAMNNHQMSHDIQLRACKAIWSFAANTDSILLINKNACKAIINSMNNHYLNVPLLENCCGTLMCLAEHNDENQLMLMNNGTGDIIIDIMKRYPDNIFIQYYGCGAFKNLSENNVNKISLIKKYAEEIIYNAMEKHKLDHDIQCQGCGALMNLSSYPDNHTSLMKINACNIIIDAMKNYQNDENIQMYACEALRNFAINEENHLMLMKINICDITINTMNNYSKNGKILDYGCEILENLLSNENVIVESFRLGIDYKLIELIENLSLQDNHGDYTSLVNNKLDKILCDIEFRKDIKIKEMKKRIDILKIGKDEKIKIELELFDIESSSSVNIEISNQLKVCNEILRRSQTLKLNIINIFNLKLLMVRYSSFCDKRDNMINEIAELELGLASNDSTIKKMVNIYKSISNINNILGDNIITHKYQPISNWKELSVQRDKLRKDYHNYYLNYIELKNKVMNLVSEKNNIEIENELTTIENEMIKIKNGLVIFTSDEGKICSSSLSLYKKPKMNESTTLGSTKLDFLYSDHNMNNKNQIILNEVDIDDNINEYKWLQEARKFVEVDLSEKEKDFKNKITLFIEELFENDNFIMNTIDNIYNDDKIFEIMNSLEKKIELKQKQDKEIMNRFNDFKNLKHLDGMNHEKEIELYNRRYQIEIILDKMKGNCLKLNDLFNNPIKNRVDICSEVILKLENEGENIKNEQNEHLEKIYHLSKKPQELISLNENKNNHHEEYDFPDIPLIAEGLLNVKKSNPLRAG